MSEVKLLGFWGSPYSKRVELALKLKGVEYEYVDEDLSNKSPLLLKSNPVSKQIPVLLHNDKPIAESMVILEYIDEAFDGPFILPRDPYERAKTRFWAKFLVDKCLPAVKRAALGTGEEQEKAKQEAKELLKFLENELEGKTFFGGNTIGLVDIAGVIFAWVMAGQELLGSDLLRKETFPKLYGWADEFFNHKIVKEVLPSKEKLIDHIQGHLKAAQK